MSYKSVIIIMCGGATYFSAKLRDYHQLKLKLNNRVLCGLRRRAQKKLHDNEYGQICKISCLKCKTK